MYQILFGLIGIFLLYFFFRPSVYVYTEKTDIPFCDQQYVTQRFWSSNNGLAGLYVHLFAKKVEIVSDTSVIVYGWFNQVIDKRIFRYPGGEHPCRNKMLQRNI